MSELPVLEPREAYALWAASYPPRAHNPMMRAEERAMLALLPSDLVGFKVLDAGCGSGRYIVHALRRGARIVLGMDLSAEMLDRTNREVLSPPMRSAHFLTRAGLIQASLEALPIRSGWADITLCGLALGHVPDLCSALEELRRVTRPGGALLCSDFHPIGEELGWPRDFKADGRRYAVRHTAHTLEAWRSAARKVGWTIRRIQEPYLNPADIPANAAFDPLALRTPVALVLELRREERNP